MKLPFFFLVLIYSLNLGAQEAPFQALDFLIGQWEGRGIGFGNEGSTITSSFTYVMNNQFIELENESVFAPSEKKPKGDHHLDKGFISFDRNRQLIVLRQFHLEGYVNQYILQDSLSTSDKLIFQSEEIENFSETGRTKWVIERISDHQIESSFFVSFDGKKFTCMGINSLEKLKIID